MSPKTIFEKLGLKEEEGIPASGDDEVRFNCPFCVKNGQPREDTKHRLYVHVAQGDRFGFYCCFNCGTKGRVKELGSLDDFFEEEEEEFHLPQREPPKLSLPDDFCPISKGMSAYKYLTSRGLTEEDIKYYDLGIAAGRIVFPDYDKNGVLDYWVARTYTDASPKYLNCHIPGLSRRSKIYNLGRYLHERKETLTIVEGPISAIIAGRDAVATYGKIVTKQQIEILNSLSARKMFVALDPDAKDCSLKVARELSRKHEIYLVDIPEGEDPATIGWGGMEELKKSAILFDTFDKTAEIAFLLGD